jgi:hypothetical protein
MADAKVSAAEALQLCELVQAWSKLGPNARKILGFIAERLVIGLAHGDFTAEHDWERETAEEEVDGAVYRAAKLLGMGAAASAADSYVPVAGDRVRIVEIWAEELERAYRYGDPIDVVGDIFTVSGIGPDREAWDTVIPDRFHWLIGSKRSGGLICRVERVK